MADSVLIIGAGISGLLLAQYLQKSNIPFQIFDRENFEPGRGFDTKGDGWGLTLDVAVLQHILPGRLFERLPETFVDPTAVRQGQASKFPFFNLNTCELMESVPGSKERVRVSRQKLRQLLTSGLHIQVSHYKSTVIS
jgi:2-polyprenyl-6-methoxyphenol hydroxylase-like FAD-dependent oxidoreductase